MKALFLTDIGNRVSHLRKQQKLSQEELAEKAETTKQTISFVESGKRELLAGNVLKIADALGVSADYLLKGIPADSDLVLLDQRAKRLDKDQYKFLETIINSFFELCESQGN